MCTLPTGGALGKVNAVADPMGTAIQKGDAGYLDPTRETRRKDRQDEKQATLLTMGTAKPQAPTLLGTVN